MGNTSKQPVQRNTYVERQKEFKQDLSKIKEDGILDEIEKKYLTEKYKLNQYQVKIISQY
ncbi:MAG: hypothetical protein LBU14_02355 [Candidatus Peribacteria bacterium]|jgi:hypothetical protein|nr:hypothetical protein [Candidatus Peribacteria bacterium]